MRRDGMAEDSLLTVSSYRSTPPSPLSLLSKILSYLKYVLSLKMLNRSRQKIKKLEEEKEYKSWGKHTRINRPLSQLQTPRNLLLLFLLGPLLPVPLGER